MRPLGWLCLLFFVGVWLALGIAWLLRIKRYAMGGRPLSWLRARLGLGLRVDDLAVRLGVSLEQLQQSPSYSVRHIPKRRGGQRKLLVPDAPTKALQRRILRRLLQGLRAHDAATAYERGRSIVDHAAPHCARAVVLTLDLVDFFPNTRPQRVQAYFQRIGWNRAAAELLTRWTTFEGGLPQGAPTSPRLANLVNHGLDARIAAFVARRRGSYTRYADDIAISFPKDYPRKVRGTIQRVRRIARAHGYRVHGKGKVRIMRPHQRQRITGLVVNDRPRLPRETRRWLRSVRHHANKGTATLDDQQLAGWAAYEAMLDRGSRR